ncbi:MFS transporter [Antrihabitans cavernicola]|uniref:Putative proline/betaine transporter n=1 Tax=Antrihabitans cavernicola TaxID=2495913 RepID=A0A5A7S6A5_9NOCA|nr:MFS transporter [Spelaeibacter cavernicola]KAA0016302.1 MFS transporter [Spelaeibacter cavernicola]
MSQESPTTTAEVPPSILRRAIGASAIGNAVEWFDYGVYAYLTVHIAASLFPEGSNGVLYTLVGFAISFLVRPIGGLFWGPLGDKIGRKRVLAMTIILMASSTVAVGLIPSYTTIGIWAPVLLYAFRMVQGFSAGGEYGGAATFMAEYAPDKKRGFYGSFLEVGTLTGFTLGNAIALLLVNTLDDGSLQSWGWRLPFFVAAPLGLIGMYLRSRMEDTPVFRELEAKEATEEVKGVFKDLITKYTRPILTLFGLVIALNVVNYTLLSYMPTYLQTTLDMKESDALLVPLFGQLAMLFTLPFFGALSDRVGRRPMWLFSCAALVVAVIPMYLLIGTSLAGAIVGFAVLGMLYAPQLATISATFPAMFPTIVRFAGVAIGYNVATSLFGGTASAINEALIDATGTNLIPAYYMLGACVIGIVAALFLIETKGLSLRGTEVPGTPESVEEQKQLAAERA